MSKHQEWLLNNATCAICVCVMKEPINFSCGFVCCADHVPITKCPNCFNAHDKGLFVATSVWRDIAFRKLADGFSTFQNETKMWMASCSVNQLRNEADNSLSKQINKVDVYFEILLDQIHNYADSLRKQLEDEYAKTMATIEADSTQTSIDDMMKEMQLQFADLESIVDRQILTLADKNKAFDIMSNISSLKLKYEALAHLNVQFIPPSCDSNESKVNVVDYASILSNNMSMFGKIECSSIVSPSLLRCALDKFGFVKYTFSLVYQSLSQVFNSRTICDELINIKEPCFILCKDANHKIFGGYVPVPMGKIPRLSTYSEPFTDRRTFLFSLGTPECPKILMLPHSPIKIYSMAFNAARGEVRFGPEKIQEDAGQLVLFPAGNFCYNSTQNNDTFLLPPEILHKQDLFGTGSFSLAAVEVYTVSPIASE